MWEEFPTCPYCEFSDQDWWDGGPNLEHDGDVALTECSQCGKEFEVTMSISYSFLSTRLEDKD